MDHYEGYHYHNELKPPRPTTNQRGAIILVALFLVFLIAVLMISLGMLHRSDLEIVTNQIEDLTAFYCAEAGIERAHYFVRSQPNWPPGNPFNGTVWNKVNCVTNAGMDASGSKYTVQVSEYRADPNDNQIFHYVQVTSTGVSPKGYERTLRMVIRRSKVWQMIPGAMVNYYGQINRYEEVP